MIERGTLEHLAQMDNRPHSTLTVYLALDSSRDKRMLELGDLFKRKEQEMSSNGSRKAWQNLSADRERVSRFVEDLSQSPGRGLALFSCSGKDVFQAHPLPVPVANLLAVGPYPYIRPLAALAGDLTATITVLLDRKQARFFLTGLGLAKELTEARLDNEDTPPPRDGDGGRAGDSGLSRRADEVMSRYFKEVAQSLKDLMDAQGCTHFLLGGSRSAGDLFLEGLPAGLAQACAGQLGLLMAATASQVAEEVTQVQTESRLERQKDRMADLMDGLKPGGKATSGLNEVLGTLYKGQVHTLFVLRDFTHSGGSCPSCGRLRHVAGPCPLCGVEMTPVDDVVNLAVAQALNSGAGLEQVSEDSGLESLGGIAAVLRYT